VPLEPSATLFAELETYYDAAPRTAADVEHIGPFTVFIKRGAGWPYYARPTLGATRFEAADVQRVRERQRELGVPEAVEWVAETSPALAAAVQAAGLAVGRHPLMVLDPAAATTAVPPDGAEVRLATPADDLALFNAVARVAFVTAPGTATGPIGFDDALAAVVLDPAALEIQRERLRAGWTRTAAVFIDGKVVGSGSHQPIGPVSEVVGVGVLPAFRRRGLAVALTSCLVDDARARGVRTVFLSAGDETIGRIYGRVGFRPIGTACVAESPA
jgi:ribosomal protein S18 acetylase RimI-like enzyme